MPTVPPAPGRLSITICCPSRALSSVATIRLVTSGPLPGPQGTMNRMGFVGYCANAEVGAKPSRTAIRASASKNLRIFPSVLTNLFNVRYGSKAAISIGFVSNTSSKHHHVLASDTVSNLPPNVQSPSEEPSNLASQSTLGQVRLQFHRACDGVREFKP